MARKKKSKVKAKPKAEVKAEPKAEKAPAPALEPEQIVTRRGTAVHGTTRMTKSEYDKQIARERGGK